MESKDGVKIHLLPKVLALLKRWSQKMESKDGVKRWSQTIYNL
jgi:hypothetical protein